MKENEWCGHTVILDRSISAICDVVSSPELCPAESASQRVASVRNVKDGPKAGFFVVVAKTERELLGREFVALLTTYGEKACQKKMRYIASSLIRPMNNSEPKHEADA
jgi:hypothetical protein